MVVFGGGGCSAYVGAFLDKSECWEAPSPAVSWYCEEFLLEVWDILHSDQGACSPRDTLAQMGSQVIHLGWWDNP